MTRAAIIMRSSGRDATAVVILGPKEADKGVVTLRWLASGQQLEVAQEQLLDALAAGPPPTQE